MSPPAASKPGRRAIISSSTIMPPPPPDPAVSQIENGLSLITLKAIGPGVFTNMRPLWQPPGARGVYGGSVIAQCLLAAQKTVPPGLWPHSMHCYFVLAGDHSIPVIYEVQDVRSGRSFATRTVQARQSGKCIFTTTCSFTKPLVTVPPPHTAAEAAAGEDYNSEAESEGEGGEEIEELVLPRVISHETSFPPDIPSPEECPSETERIDTLLSSGTIDSSTADYYRYRLKTDPFEWRRIPSSSSSPSSPAETQSTTTTTTHHHQPPHKKLIRHWVRSKSPISSPTAHMPALAYFSDSGFIGIVTRVNSAAKSRDVGMMVSLDHAIYFHAGPETRVDRWLMVEKESPWAGNERGFVVQRIFEPPAVKGGQGRLVASAFQEGLVRLRDGREGGREEASKL